MVDLGEHRRLRGAAHQRERDVVERALQIVRRLQRGARHPDDAEAAIVGHQLAGAQRVDILRRQRHADDVQVALAPIDDCGDLIAGAQPVRIGERLANERLPRLVRRRSPAAAQCDIVQCRLANRRQRQQARTRRLVHIGHIKRNVDGDAGADARHAGNLGQPVGNELRRAFDVGEHVGEAVTLIIGGTRIIQRHHGAEGHDHDRHTTADDHRDRQCLAAEMPQIPQQSAVERRRPHHQLSSSAGLLSGFRRTSATWPSAR